MTYYVTFIQYHPFFFKELLSTLRSSFSEVRVRFYQNNSLHSIEQMPLPNETYPYTMEDFSSWSWYIHGSVIGREQPCDLFKLFSPSEIDLTGVDTLFQSFSEHYVWSLFPWGIQDNNLKDYFFIYFAFVSSNESCHNLFTKIFSEIEAKHASEHRLSLRISNYNIESKLSKHVQALVFNSDSSKDYGERIWEACQCDMSPPWLITDLYPGFTSEEIQEILGIDSNSSTNIELDRTDSIDKNQSHQEDEIDCDLYQWKKDDFQLIKVLRFSPEDPGLPPGFTKVKLGVLQPRDKNIFGRMCRAFRSSSPQTLIIVSQGADLDGLQNVLKKTEIFYSSLDLDLCYFNEILKTTKWFYGIDRWCGPSLFISKDNTLIQNVNVLSIDDSYSLVSCF